MLGTVTAATFKPLIGQTFQAEPQGEAFTLTDAVVSKYAEGRPAGSREPFALFFRGQPGGPTREQGTYELTNEALGTLPIFIVPIAAEKDGALLFQAVFS